MKRAAGMMTGTPSGIRASSRTRRYRSATTRPPLTSGIDTLLEWLDAEALHRFEKDFVRPLAQLKVGRHDVLHHVCHLGIRHGWTEQHTEFGILVGATSDGHLEIFLAVLFD